MRDLAVRVHTGVRAAGPFDPDGLPGEARQGSLEDGLHRARSVRLPLPAVEIRPHVRECGPVSRQAIRLRRTEHDEEHGERDVLEGVDGGARQPGGRIQQRVGQNDRGAEVEEGQVARPRGEGQDPQQVPRMERGREQKQCRERSEDGGLDVADPPGDRDESRGGEKGERGAGEEAGVEKGEGRLHPGGPSLPARKRGLGAFGNVRSREERFERRIRDRVEFPASRVVRETAPGRYARPTRGDPEGGAGRERRRRESPLSSCRSVTNDGKRRKERNVLGHDREGERHARANGPPPREIDEAREEQRDAEGVEMALSRALRHGQRVEGIERGREARAGAAESVDAERPPRGRRRRRAP